MPLDELRLTPLRPIHALPLGALDYSTHDLGEAIRPMRYAMIRRWVITACMRPQVTAFLVCRADAVIGACSLTSSGHRSQTVEIHLACPEASQSDDLAGVLTLLELIARAQGGRRLGIWVRASLAQDDTVAASGFVESGCEPRQLQTLDGHVEAVEWTKSLYPEPTCAPPPCILESAAC